MDLLLEKIDRFLKYYKDEKELPKPNDDYFLIEGVGYFPKSLSIKSRPTKYTIWEKEDQDNDLS